MKIWKLMYDQDYENFIYKDNKYFDFFNKNFKGEKIIGHYDVIEVETSFKGEKAQNGECGDIFSLGTKPIFTKKVVEVLKNELDRNVQYIKLKHNVYGECYAINVIKVIDCLDEENSIIKRMASGKIFNISKYMFKEDIDYPSIFKIPTDGEISIFVTDNFMKCMNLNELIGLECKIVWESKKP